jgi:hypothetical protein
MEKLPPRKSKALPEFWDMFKKLPPDVQCRAHKAYALWRETPGAGSLHFKRVNNNEPIYSFRISKGYRALGLYEDDTVHWYFIGNHDQYESELRK